MSLLLQYLAIVCVFKVILVIKYTNLKKISDVVVFKSVLWLLISLVPLHSFVGVKLLQDKEKLTMVLEKCANYFHDWLWQMLFSLFLGQRAWQADLSSAVSNICSSKICLACEATKEKLNKWHLSPHPTPSLHTPPASLHSVSASSSVLVSVSCSLATVSNDSARVWAPAEVRLYKITVYLQCTPFPLLWLLGNRASNIGISSSPGRHNNIQIEKCHTTVPFISPIPRLMVWQIFLCASEHGQSALTMRYNVSTSITLEICTKCSRSSRNYFCQLILYPILYLLLAIAKKLLFAPWWKAEEVFLVEYREEQVEPLILLRITGYKICRNVGEDSQMIGRQHSLCQ